MFDLNQDDSGPGTAAVRRRSRKCRGTIASEPPPLQTLPALDEVWANEAEARIAAYERGENRGAFHSGSTRQIQTRIEGRILSVAEAEFSTRRHPVFTKMSLQARLRSTKQYPQRSAVSSTSPSRSFVQRRTTTLPGRNFPYGILTSTGKRLGIRLLRSAICTEIPILVSRSMSTYSYLSATPALHLPLRCSNHLPSTHAIHNAIKPLPINTSGVRSMR